MSFREDIEKILTEGCAGEMCAKPITCKECWKDKENRIISAHNADLERIAAGMPQPAGEHDTTEWDDGYFMGAKSQLKADQAHVRKEQCQTLVGNHRG